MLYKIEHLSTECSTLFNIGEASTRSRKSKSSSHEGGSITSY